MVLVVFGNELFLLDDERFLFDKSNSDITVRKVEDTGNSDRDTNLLHSITAISDKCA